jgi:hypothetical protein
MAVWDRFCKPLLRRPVHRALLRSVWLAVPPMISATACLQRNYVERYSRFMRVNKVHLRYLLQGEKADVSRFITEPQCAPRHGRQKGHGHRLPPMAIRVIGHAMRRRVVSLNCRDETYPHAGTGTRWHASDPDMLPRRERTAMHWLPSHDRRCRPPSPESQGATCAANRYRVCGLWGR